MNYLDLRVRFPHFVYKDFSYGLKGKDLIAEFLFEVGEYVFKPSIVFKNIPLERFKTLNKLTLDNLIFHAGMAEIPTYWKAFASPNILIKPAYIERDQISWWTDLLMKGMGQYFYENSIDFTTEKFVNIFSEGSNKYLFEDTQKHEGTLIPVGGGKDSSVTLELIKSENKVAALFVNPTEAALNLAKVSGIKELVLIERNLDKKILQLNKLGFLNGHTPFSSLIAFLSVAASYIYGFSEIALSNERSSDEENTIFMGRSINHQYSKTFEFENKFRDYVNKHLTNVNYFSFLRPLYEIQIAKIFSKMDEYFPIFRSCNVGQKTNSWCSNCSKCLSTYILLMPFFTKEKLLEIFGEDLILKPSLKNTLSDLIDNSKVKPFECVGTREELKQAIDGNIELISSWNLNHNLPEKYERILRKEIQK